MGIGKHYDGYRSFQYLTPGKDYKAFELTPELDRVDPYRVPLNEDEELAGLWKRSRLAAGTP